MAVRSLLRSCSVATALVVSSWVATPAFGQDRLTVLSVGPEAHALEARTEAVVGVEFDRPLDPSSITDTSFWVFGRWSGVARGKLKILGDGRRIRLTPERGFSAGESVMVVLSRDLRAMDGTSLREAGYSYQFWTRSRGAGFDFSEIDRFSTRTEAAVTTRSYGGFGSDLNDDGHLDLTIVNEDTDDLRTFLNRGDRSGSFQPFLRPTQRTGNVPSPSEPTDFDRDGRVDVVVANTQDDSVSVLLGHGDGTFRRTDHYTVGGEPRGVTVLDADGDGDMDIAATSFIDGSVTLLFNDGAAGFQAAATFGTNSGERAIAAGDMNGDGILDLVVGALSAERVDVYLGNGDGTFSSAGSQAAGGQVWMLVLGDVDRNGTEDVALVNGQSNNAAILLGDGAGGLAPPAILETDRFPLATDLADLDGDGDLDWVTSSFSGDWMLFENDGLGGFTHERSFDAPQAASCSIPMDLDNDGVLDLVLIDELADEIVLMKSHAVLFESDFEAGTLEEWAKAPRTRVVEPGLRESSYALEVSATGKRAYAHTKFRPAETSLVVSFDLDLLDFDPGDEQIDILTYNFGNGALTLTKKGKRPRASFYVHDWRRGWRRIGRARLPKNGPVRLRVDWAEASDRDAADGYAALFKNGRRRGVALDVANHTRGDGGIGGIRLGLPRGADGATGGPLLIDNVRITR